MHIMQLLHLLPLAVSIEIVETRLPERPQRFSPLFNRQSPPHRHFERTRPTFSFPFASCEWVGLRREKSLFDRSSTAMFHQSSNHRIRMHMIQLLPFPLAVNIEITEVRLPERPQRFSPLLNRQSPPHRHFERSRPTFSFPFASCEWVGLRREKSLFDRSSSAN
jgi:hypothetical protein